MGEFIASLLATMGDLEEDLLDKTFAVMDVDGNGTITVEEMSAVITGGGRDDAVLADGTTVGDVFKAADVSGDGKVSKQEFVEFLRDQRKTFDCNDRARDSDSDGGASVASSEPPEPESISCLLAHIASSLSKVPHPSASNI